MIADRSVNEEYNIRDYQIFIVRCELFSLQNQQRFGNYRIKSHIVSLISTPIILPILNATPVYG
ncbi:MAG: hypothetical protein ACRD5J_20355, partial [Nitrososphaeraceae archaeon]